MHLVSPFEQVFLLLGFCPAFLPWTNVRRCARLRPNFMRLRTDPTSRFYRAHCSVVGLAIGDAYGERFVTAPHEWYASSSPPPGEWNWTDDTAMALSVLEVLRSEWKIEQEELAERFAERYEAEPNRGYAAGAAKVLLAIGKGTPWREAAGALFGGTGSYGNGAAMRAGPIGAYFADDPDRIVSEARLSAEVTHLHPEGISGAVAVAVAAGVAARGCGKVTKRLRGDLLDAAIESTPDGETRARLRAVRATSPAEPAPSVARSVGCGHEASAPDTVPFALWVASRHLDDFYAALRTAVCAGGDLDTVAAIVGSVVAPAVGEEGIPAYLRRRVEPVPGIGLR